MKFCPYTLLKLCQDCGFDLTRGNGRLIAAPFSKLTPEMLEALRRHKAALLAILPESPP